MTVIGASIRKLAYKEMGSQFTFEMSLKKKHRLVTSGVYSWVRHPSYTGLAFFITGSTLCHASKVIQLLIKERLISN